MNPLSKLKCSIIIRCYNEGKYLPRLLNAIFQQTHQNCEIVIVDSESTDNTQDILKNYDVRVVKIKKSDFTYGYALNLGCKVATGDILISVSAHTYPLNELWLENMLRPFSDNNNAIVYGKQRGDYRNKYSEHRIFEKWFPDENIRVQTNPFCNNANAAIRKNIWEQFMFDETLTGLEDLDMAMKVATRGYKIKYVPEATIIHIHEESMQQVYNRYQREAIAMRRIMPYQRFGFKNFVFCLTSNVFMDFLQARKDRVFIEKFKEIIGFRFMQFWATYKGWKFQDKCSQKRSIKQIFYHPAALNSKTLKKHTTRKPA